jgi:RHS repeat-associated protein
LASPALTGGPGGANPQTPPGPSYQTIAARYEYDPYGNNALDPLNAAQSGTYAATNAFRFSTKPFDAETGLSYFGYRYYAPGMGRWVNRDPIGEGGGINLLSAVDNDPNNKIDSNGQFPIWIPIVFGYAMVEWCNAPAPGDAQYTGWNTQAMQDAANVGSMAAGWGMIRGGYMLLVCGGEVVSASRVGVSIAYGADLLQS